MCLCRWKKFSKGIVTLQWSFKNAMNVGKTVVRTKWTCKASDFHGKRNFQWSWIDHHQSEILRNRNAHHYWFPHRIEMQMDKVFKSNQMQRKWWTIYVPQFLKNAWAIDTLTSLQPFVVDFELFHIFCIHLAQTHKLHYKPIGMYQSILIENIIHALWITNIRLV